jgi:hypothetical protein
LIIEDFQAIFYKSNNYRKYLVFATGIPSAATGGVAGQNLIRA